MPNNSKTTWRCAGCEKANQSTSAATTCASSTVLSSSVSIPLTAAVSASASSIESDVSFIKEMRDEIDKQGALANLEESDYQIITVISYTGLKYFCMKQTPPLKVFNGLHLALYEILM